MLGARLTLRLSGAAPQKLINLASQQGIRVYLVTKEPDGSLLVQLDAADFYLLRPLCRNCGCRCRIIRRHGVVFSLLRLKKRPQLLIGALLFGFLLLYGGSLILEVRVTSPEQLKAGDESRIKQLLAEQDIKVGASFWTVDLQKAQGHLLDNFDGLVYLQLKREGSALVAEAVRRSVPKADEAHLPPGDLLAARDGVIQKLLVRRGVAVKKVGDTVTAGELLVQGVDAFGAPCAASAICQAVTWYSAEETCAYRQDIRSSTGLSYSTLRLQKADGKSFYLKGGPKVRYQKYACVKEEAPLTLWRILPLAVEIKIIEETYYEQKSSQRQLQADEAAVKAQALARQAVLALLPQKAVVLDTDLRLYADDNHCRAVFAAAVSEDIGKFAQHQP